MRDINYFDNDGIFIIVLHDIKRQNGSQEIDENIVEFVKSPIMERLTNSVFLVLRDASRVDIWGQVIFFVLVSISFSKDSFKLGDRLSATYLGTYENGRLWAGKKWIFQKFVLTNIKGGVNFLPKKLERIEKEEFNVSAFHYPPKVRIIWMKTKLL